MSRLLCATIGVIMFAAATGAVLGGEQGTPPEVGMKMTNSPVLSMKHTGGWATGVLGHFILEKDGTFQWQSKKGNATGTIPKEEVSRLVKDVSSAGAGPAAEDAGYVEFKWMSEDGKAGTRDYSFPSEEPCRRLLKAIEDLVTKYGKSGAEQSGGTLRR